jgi:hypothetical protein
VSGASERFAGPIANDVTVGFTKNPLQLTANPKLRSAANAPISFNFFAGMFLGLLGPLVQGLGGDPVLEIVAEKEFHSNYTSVP